MGQSHSFAIELHSGQVVVVLVLRRERRKKRVTSQLLVNSSIYNLDELLLIMINHQDVRRDKAMMLYMLNSNLMFVVIYINKFQIKKQTNQSPITDLSSI